eukprot:Skav231590  [mRNA]  locus=scaffold232:130648:138570:+ [translate_table: standard]
MNVDDDCGHRRMLGARSRLLRRVLEELREIGRLGVPLALSSASGSLNGLVTWWGRWTLVGGGSTCPQGAGPHEVSSVLLGRLGTVPLAAVSVSGIWTSITDVLFFSGRPGAGTAGAYGAGQYALVGTWLQIYLVFVTLAGTPFMLLRFFTTPILEAVRLRHDVAVTAGVYTVWSQAGFLFDVWYASVKEYYAAQQVTVPAAVVDAVTIVENFVVVYIAVFVMKGGIIGAALAFCEICVVQRWSRLLAMTVPAAIGGLAEELQFQVPPRWFPGVPRGCGRGGLVVGGLAGEAWWLVRVMNVLILAFLFSMAMGDSVGIRMAKSLGEGNAEHAAFVARLGIIASVVGGTFIAGGAPRGGCGWGVVMRL